MTRAWKELGRYGGVGIELVLAILILGGIGHWLDTRFGRTRDWGMTIGFFLGIAVGVRNLVRVATHMQKDIEKAEAQDPEASRWTVDESWVQASQEPGKDDKDGDERPN
jgi:putative F0F1-ATPase subunit (Ca2+/Mg2+ transporter)